MYKLRLYQSTPYSCSYLQNKTAHHYATYPHQELNNDIHSLLINMGFRRSGHGIYKPNCLNCNQCVSLRIPVKKFTPSQSQSRILAKNSDLDIIIVTSPRYEEYFDLYQRYIEHRHDNNESMTNVEDTFSNFFFSSWSETFLMEYRLSSGKLICVAICDPVKQGWSAVYTFFDTDFSKRSLGTYSILKQIELLQFETLDYLYLGYWIQDCTKMNYKTNFTPCEKFINEKWLEHHG